MSNIINSRRRRTVVAGVALLLVAASVAAAAWLLSASGPGAGKIGVLGPVTVSAGPTGLGILPNSDGDLAVHLNSANDQALKIVSVTSSGDPVQLMGGGALGSCSAQDINDALSVATKTFSTPIAVAPGQSDVVLPGVVHAADIPNGCQAQSFTVAVKLSVST